MRTLDETDLDILSLLVEDARRPYSDIAERVDVSAPTVSDRIDRLRDLGVIQRFTVDLDRTTFTDGIEVLLDVRLVASADDRVAERFAALDEIEHVFQTAEARVFAVATVPPDAVRQVLAEAVDLELVDDYRVHVLDERLWAPTISPVELTLSCEECEDSVGGDGVSLQTDDELYHFCSRSCRSAFENRRLTMTETA